MSDKVKEGQCAVCIGKGSWLIMSGPLPYGRYIETIVTTGMLSYKRVRYTRSDKFKPWMWALVHEEDISERMAEHQRNRLKEILKQILR